MEIKFLEQPRLADTISIELASAACNLLLYGQMTSAGEIKRSGRNYFAIETDANGGQTMYAAREREQLVNALHNNQQADHLPMIYDVGPSMEPGLDRSTASGVYRPSKAQLQGEQPGFSWLGTSGQSESLDHAC
jgi:hypothetical protein